MPSVISSYCVAEVEYESCADELRLCGGDPTLMKPSELLAPALRTDFIPSEPFSRLGVFPEVWVSVLIAVFGLRAADAPLERGLGGRLARPLSPRGG